MKVDVIIKKEDDTVVKEQHYHVLTEIQWRKQFCKPKKYAHPIRLEWWISTKQKSSADYYDEEDVHKMSNREIEKIRRATAEERYEKRQEKKWYNAHPWWDESHTAWQWLQLYGRIPASGAESFSKHYNWDAWDTGELIHGDACDRTWWYYTGADTIQAPEELEKKLKQLYVEKFGGWEQIDLEHTTYDGHAWWTESDLKGFKLPNPEVKKWPRYKPRNRKAKSK